MWEALALVAFGVGVGLAGRQLRQWYFRDFDDPARERADPLFASNAQLLRRFIAVFLTAGTMLGIVGLYLAADEAWRFLRGG